MMFSSGSTLSRSLSSVSMSSATLSPAISYKSPKRKSDTIYSTSPIDIKQGKFMEDEEILILYGLIFTSEKKTDLGDI